MVLQCPGCGGRHPIAFHCGHKACGRCAAIQRRRKVDDLWPLAKTFEKPRFLTLTFKSRHHLTAEWRREQFVALRKFLKNREIAAKLGGGIWAWEITYNQRLKMWHPHFHILFDGAYIKKAEIKETWRNLADGAFIVDVREVKGEDEAAKMGALRETVKYITKGVAFVDDEKLLTEFLAATKGMRRFGVFGKCHGYRAPKPDAGDKTRWLVNPFTGRGPRALRCDCGFEALPDMFRIVGVRGYLWSDEEAAFLARIRGAPDPVLLLLNKQDRRAAEPWDFETLFDEEGDITKGD